MGSVINIFSTCFTAVSSWFTLVIDATGMGGIFLAVIFISVLFRKLIFPIFGHAGSDKAKKKDNEV